MTSPLEIVRSARARMGLILLASCQSSVAALASDDRMASILQRKLVTQGKNWQSTLPAIGTSMGTTSNAWPLAGQAFDHASSSSCGAFCECSIYSESKVSGRVLFNLAGDTEGASLLQALFSSCVVELTHIDVDEKCRGRGGGPLLMRLMLDELASRDEEGAPQGRHVPPNVLPLPAWRRPTVFSPFDSR